MAVHCIDAVHLHSVQARLGEGPVWDSRAQVLWFVDIVAPAIHCFNPVTGQCAAWAAPDKVGWVLPTPSGLVAGLADGLYSFSPDSGEFELLQNIEAELPDNRLNDGALDSRGNIWFGTMDDLERSETGRFYRFDGRCTVDVGIAPVCITNGPALSPLEDVLYAVDSLGRRILSYPVNEDLSLGSGGVFVAFSDTEGFPDGVTCDAEGGVWVGVWDGWAARRYSADGVLTDEVSFPTANITKVALGGPDGRTAYATSARNGLDAKSLASQPLAGDLFSFRVRVPGAVFER